MRHQVKWLVALCAIACAAAPEEQETVDVETGTAEQDLSACQFHGWRFEDDWNHHRCNPFTASNVCMYPRNYSVPGVDPAELRYNMKVRHPGPVLGYNSAYSFALDDVKPRIETVSSFRIFLGPCTKTGGDACNLWFSKAAIAGSYQKTILPLSEVTHIACEDGITFSESFPAEIMQCRQIVASVDSDKFENWMTWRGLSDGNKKNQRRQLMLHIVGVLVGLGSTDADNTSMRLTFSSQNVVGLQTFEESLLWPYDPWTPGVTIYSCP